MEDLKTYIQENEDISIRTTFEFNVNIILTKTAAKEPTSTKMNSIWITDTNKNQLISMLGSGCEQSMKYKKNTVDSELFLSITPSVNL
jgi:hypothetical protein